LAAGLRPNPLGELTALPQNSLDGLRGEARAQGKKRGCEGKRREDREKEHRVGAQSTVGERGIHFCPKIYV